ncbi:MAG: protein kinase, partial [Chloroflexota bacterium]
MANHALKLAVGGPVQVKQGTYLTRPADELLLTACRDSNFAYVLACRQIGKSSLMFETSKKLTQAGIRTALIDLNSIGQGVEADEWYFSLLDELARRLKLKVDVPRWWEARPRLSTRNQRLLQFLREVVLKEITGPVVIFVDEIDMTLGLEFTDDFFAAIRSVYNDRAQVPAFQRLTFVLLGVATPDELIKDHTRTPFNIGQAISLHDFSRKECEPFRLEIEAKYPQRGRRYFEQIYEWTGGHPYLTQKLCEALLAVAPKLEQAGPGLVDRLVREHFLAAEARSEDNLHFVQNRVTGDPYNEEMLKIYRQVLEGDPPAPDNEQSPPINRLKLYGLILAREGRLAVRNKLYAQVFDLSWANEMLRLSNASFRLGLPQHYRVIQELGQGGFSTVYLTQLRDSDQSQSIALKVLRKDAINDGYQLRRFKQEARTVSQLDHPNIIHIYETGGEDKDTLFIAMEYIPGGTVRHRLKSGPLPREEAVHIVKQIGSALTYAHEHGVIHRDIKPGNILLDTGRQPVRPVLTDFGLIKLLATDELSKIESSAVLGTFDYMAPEQWRREPPTPATDVYALAITLFEMLSGKRPFMAESPFELMNQHAHAPLPLLSEIAPQVGPYFDEVLRKAAAKNPADRFLSMAEFMAAIDQANAKAEQLDRIEQQARAATAIDAVAGYIQKGRYDPDKALTMIEAALEMYPDYGAALRLRGKIYLEQGKIEEALQDLQQAYQQVGDPTSEIGLEYLKILRQVADHHWLQQMYRKAVHYYDTVRQIMNDEAPGSAFIQDIWTEVRSRLIDFHHHEGVLAYAGGEPDNIDEAITTLKLKLRALKELKADSECQELQAKLVQVQISKYEKIIREAEQNIDEIGSKSSTIRFSNEEIFQHYQAIDEAQRALLEFEPDNQQWQQARRKRLYECAQSRCVFASRALGKLQPDYEAALRHYQAVQEIEETKYPGLAQELNLNLADKINEL